MKKCLTFFVACLFSTSIAFTEVPIGNGFACNGSTIFKGTQEVAFSKAKSTIAKTLKKLKSKLKTATKAKKPAIKAKIEEANNSKTLLTACSQGTLAPGLLVDPIFTDLAGGSGTYKGSYSGVVDSFFPLFGEVTMQFILDGTTFSGILSLGGNLGSALNAQPLTFANNVAGIAFPAQFFLAGTFIGDVTLSITQAGGITITNANSPNASVNLTGQFAAQAISTNLSGTYSGHTFSGTGNLVRQP